MSGRQIGNIIGLTPKYSIQISNTKTKLVDPRATRALVALMNQHAVIGGAAAHWGGPSAFAEIMSALFGIFSESTGHWCDHFNFVNDAGHAENGLYALQANYGMNGLTFDDLRGFRSVKSKLTGHGENHLYPEGVLLSNGPLGSSAAQAEGLAIADKLSRNNKITVLTISDGACMEGEAKEAFSSIPGFAARGRLNPFLMIISDNNTKLSGRIDVDSFSQNPTFDSLVSLGWETIKVTEGHNLQNLYNVFNQSIEKLRSQSAKPIAIVVKTIKGKGIADTEKSKSGGHGYPLKAYDSKLVDFLNEIYHGSAPSEFIDWANQILESRPEKPEGNNDMFQGIEKGKVQLGISKALNRLKKEGLPIVSVTADLAGSTGVAGFQKENPESTIDVGVAESNMISIAAGISKNGFIPIVDTFAQFGITKGNLPLIMANLSSAPIIAIFTHTGYQDAADGASHQATTYFSAVGNIPHTKVISLSHADQAEKVLESEIKTFHSRRLNGETPDSIIFFLGRENFPHHYGCETNDSQVNVLGKDALLVCTGPMVKEALEAKSILDQEGINISVVENMRVNAPNIEEMSVILAKNGNKLVTVEDHQLEGGMGSYLTHGLLRNGKSFSYLGLGIKGSFGRSAHKASHLYKNMGLSANEIAKSIKKFINQR